MSDLEKWKTFLAGMGVGFEETNVTNPTVMAMRDATSFLVLTAEKSGRVGGYAGFFNQIEFDAEGRFLCMGMWE